MTPSEALRLRPGFFAVRRDDTHLQVGLDGPRVVLPDTPDVRRLVAALEHGGALPQMATAREALARLAAADLVVPAQHPEPLAAAHGLDAARRSSARAAVRVAASGPEELVAAAGDLLASAGLSRADGEGDVALLLATSALRRERADALVREGLPHLPVVATSAGWTIGPFVAPGRSACLRCLDATASEQDPRYPLVLEQLAERDVPRDVVTQQLALAWAVNEIVMWADGETPTTSDATVTVCPSAAPRTQQWRRHPHCGCAWDLLTSA